jgi:uncharacterized membrane protein YqhA
MERLIARLLLISRWLLVPLYLGLALLLLLFKVLMSQSGPIFAGFAVTC